MEARSSYSFLYNRGPLDRDAVKEAVKEALNEELKAFYIDRETHYIQHTWLAEMIKYCDQCKTVIGKTVVSILVGGTADGGKAAGTEVFNYFIIN